MGRRWRYTSKNIKHNNYTCLNRLGVIDYEKNDQMYVGKTKQALSWIRDVDKDGHKLNKPIDAFNHAIDAMRYLAVMELQNKKNQIRVRV